MQYWDEGHMDGGWSALMVLGMVGVWLLLAALVVWAVWAVRGSREPILPPRGRSAGPGESTTGSAETILATRLAMGEIDLEEYRTRLGALRSGPTA